MPTVSLSGMSLHYLDSGAGDPVLLLHSGGMSSRQWARLASRLEPRRRVLVPDLLGYGASSPWPPGRSFHFGEDAALVAALVDQLGAPVHLVGHSYGGLLALHVALARPMAVRSISVYEPVAFGVLHSTGDEAGLLDLAANEEDGSSYRDAGGGEGPWLERFIDYWNGKGAWGALPEPTRQGFLAVGRKVFLEVRSLMADRTSHESYAHIAAPSLLLSGDRSPPAARRVCAILGEALPRAAHVAVEGAGHMGPLTHSNAVNALVEEHILSS